MDCLKTSIPQSSLHQIRGGRTAIPPTLRCDDKNLNENSFNLLSAELIERFGGLLANDSLPPHPARSPVLIPCGRLKKVVDTLSQLNRAGRNVGPAAGEAFVLSDVASSESGRSALPQLTRQGTEGAFARSAETTTSITRWQSQPLQKPYFRIRQSSPALMQYTWRNCVVG